MGLAAADFNGDGWIDIVTAKTWRWDVNSANKRSPRYSVFARANVATGAEVVVKAGRF